jgi:tetratricopeptide (TPR) repeat protein
LANVASIYLEKKQFARAEIALRDVLRRFAKASLPSDNFNVAISRMKLGRSLMGQKRYSEAVPELLGGYEVLKRQQDPSVSWLVKARHDLVEAYEALGKPEKAEVFRVEAASGRRLALILTPGVKGFSFRLRNNQ